MSIKILSVVLLLLGVAACLQDWRVVETSDSHFNEVMNRFDDKVVVHVKTEDSFNLTGGCNECTITSGKYECTERQCFREAPSETFVSQIVSQPKNFKKMG